MKIANLKLQIEWLRAEPDLRWSKRPLIRTWLAGAMAAAGLFFVSVAYAQPAVQPVLAQLKVTPAGAKNYVVETLITVALMGGVLFIICKTSRRT